MNKNIKFFTTIWAILLALFNIIAFVTPNETATMTKFGGAFWSGYIFITLAFIGQLAVAYFAFKARNLQKLFYKIPLIRISWTGLILTLIFGSLCMIIPDLPHWVCIIICFVILGFNGIALAKATIAADVVSQVDDKVKVQTFFIKSFTVDAEGLLARAQSDEIKAECKKVYEAARYSDPMSSNALAAVESQITLKFAELSTAVGENNLEVVKKCANETIILLDDRNKRCRLFK